MKLRKCVLTAAGGLALLGAAAAMACSGSGGGAEGGGEVALVSVTDPATKLVFKYPATWTRTSESPLTFSGQDEYISVEVRPLSGGDVLAAAKADEAAVKALALNYKPVSVAVSTEVKDSAVTSYEWDLAKSAVTGKPVHERADRYYINLGNGQIAILTGSSPAARFDREQVRDIALTVQVSK
jgi:hypothetical protein